MKRPPWTLGTVLGAVLGAWLGWRSKPPAPPRIPGLPDGVKIGPDGPPVSGPPTPPELLHIELPEPVPAIEYARLIEVPEDDALLASYRAAIMACPYCASEWVASYPPTVGYVPCPGCRRAVATPPIPAHAR